MPYLLTYYFLKNQIFRLIMQLGDKRFQGGYERERIQSVA